VAIYIKAFKLLLSGLDGNPEEVCNKQEKKMVR
jgi:hypothetical protein